MDDIFNLILLRVLGYKVMIFVDLARIFFSHERKVIIMTNFIDFYISSVWLIVSACRYPSSDFSVNVLRKKKYEICSPIGMK